MTKVLEEKETLPMVINLPPTLEMDEEQFFEFCRVNSELRIERTASGELIIMPPTGGETSHRNINLSKQMAIWAERDNTGVAFDSSGGFILPNGATRSPDVSWVKRSRLATLTSEQKQKFLPLCPDFVIELRSPSDSLAVIKEKMEEYLDNGAELGWLIDAKNRQVYVYRSGSAVECLNNPETLSGEPLLSGFTLDLRDVWEPDL